MKYLKIIGIALFTFSFVLFFVSITFSSHRLNEETLAAIDNEYRREAIRAVAGAEWEKEYQFNYNFGKAMYPVLKKAQQRLDSLSGVDPEQEIWNATNLPEGVDEWSYRMGDGTVAEYNQQLMTSNVSSMTGNNPFLFFFLVFILGTIGALLYILPGLRKIPGIKHDHIFFNQFQKGIVPALQMIVVAATFLATCYVMWKAGTSEDGIFHLVVTLAITALIMILIGIYEAREGRIPWKPGTTSIGNGWLGILLGTFLIIFYVLLYFHDQYIYNWVRMVDPVKQAIWGDPTVRADKWFLYGFMYTLVMVVMGIRMFIKYRHNKYQLIRTGSVLFFQISFAFMIPEVLAILNTPAYNITTPWPLDYSFFYDYRLNDLGLAHEGQAVSVVEAGTEGVKGAKSFLGMHLGVLLFGWGLFLALVLVPLFTYLYGKRWYCSWVCGCGGLAETLGDPFRQQSDKTLRAWRVERYVIHSVLVFVVIMTGLQIYQYFVAPDASTINLGFVELNIYQVRRWYGFLIGSMFAGVVGTGFYPIMGNRMWCRYGCPLAAILGIVQRFKSRFRITTNGGQCISCGNCSTYCEMGIDVRAYAQRGQDIVRASCVGCGVCSAVCPRGVLRLENSGEDVNTRALDVRNVHVQMDDVTLPKV
jgi:Pyruvate/2-oxoacid:ferredoxin oxidoreductase delta subunit